MHDSRRYLILLMKCFFVCLFQLNFYFKTILDSYAVKGNNTNIIIYPLPSFLQCQQLPKSECNSPTRILTLISQGTEHFHQHKDPSLCPFIPNYSHFPLLNLGKCFYSFHFYTLAISRIVYTWHHLLCNLSRLAFFLQHTSLQIHPGCCVCQVCFFLWLSSTSYCGYITV